MEKEYMKQALSLARQAIGLTSPNPMVGAIIVHEGEIVGQGWHKCAGTEHAEIHALVAAGERAKGATMYVTLEPCSHHGRTGPCADAIIRSGITKVVVAMTDPNPLVSGQGLARLRAAGIEVEEGLLASQAAQLNEVFIKWISTNMPFTMIKTAMTLDGKIATANGQSQWITGSEARRRVHTFRDSYDGILVGIGTVLADNPQLTTRLPTGGYNPIRIVVDSMARTPLTAKVVTDGLAPTIIAVTPQAPQDKIAALEALGAEVLIIPSLKSKVDIRKLFRELGAKRITSVMIEGGSEINFAALSANVVDKVSWFIAPKIIGGQSAPGPVGGQGLHTLNDAMGLEDITTEFVGDDILISAYLRQREGRNVYRNCGRIR